MRKLLITTLLLPLIVGASPQQPDHYRAAVVQCAARGNHSLPVAHNLQLVSEWIDHLAHQAASQHVQILVLPEALGWGASIDWNNASHGRLQAHAYAVAGHPVGSVPCGDQNHSWWATASCAAQRHGLVLVLNGLHKVRCDGTACPPDGWWVFNAEVAFSEVGQVLAVYHKSHIWGTAPILDEPDVADPTSFSTAFGVKFGMFVCYDIEFNDWLAPLRAQGIRHFVFSTNWMVDSPPLYAIHMLQQGVSLAHKSVLLAANLDTPGGSGSGIYAAGEVLAVYFNSTNAASHHADDRMLVTDVPKWLPEPKPNSHQADDLRHTLLDDGLDIGQPCQYEQLAGDPGSNPSVFHGKFTDVNNGRCAFVSPEPKGSKQTLVATQGQVKCQADVEIVGEITPGSTDLVLFAAKSNVSVADTPDSEMLEACAMMLCSRPSTAAEQVVCDTLWSAPHDQGSIKLLELRAQFSPNRTSVVPMAAVDDLALLQASQIAFKPGPQPSLKVELEKAQRLYSAVLYAQFQ